MICDHNVILLWLMRYCSYLTNSLIMNYNLHMHTEHKCSAALYVVTCDNHHRLEKYINVHSPLEHDQHRVHWLTDDMIFHQFPIQIIFIFKIKIMLAQWPHKNPLQRRTANTFPAAQRERDRSYFLRNHCRNCRAHSIPTSKLHH